MRFLLSLVVVIVLASCSSGGKKPADMIVHNAVIYTVDKNMSVKQAMAIRGGKILATGTNEEILNAYESANTMDAQGKSIYPGFIDAHCHFTHYGLNLKDCDLTGTRSWKEVVERVKNHADKADKSKWIVGRGWDQNDWDDKSFPDRKQLDSLYPERPVILKRIDGHAVIVNQEAMKRAGINENTVVKGGSLLRRKGSNELSGVLVDNAVELVEKILPRHTEEEYRDGLLEAQARCFAVGLTTVDDAGLMQYETKIIDSLQKINELKMRIYAMLSDSDSNIQYLRRIGQYRSPKLTIKAIKCYLDGALGSRGALMKTSYTDSANWRGLRLTDTMRYWRNCVLARNYMHQVCSHAIGDSATLMALSNYALALVSDSLMHKDTTMRWRIEHAQIIDPADYHYFKECRIIPSVQPTHATSDMYWAKNRIGDERMANAYAYKKLLEAAGMIALGTDFPVEDINPMLTFYAATARMDKNEFPSGGFQTENALSREETLKGMTIWAAYANFEEKDKGSLEPGKYADFVILDNDIMKIDLKKVPSVKVISTFIGGEKVYGK